MSIQFRDEETDPDDIEAILQLLKLFPDIPENAIVNGAVFALSYTSMDTGDVHYVVRTPANEMRKLEMIGLMEMAKLDVIRSYETDED